MTSPLTSPRRLVALGVLGLGACADPCVDDGLGQKSGNAQECPALDSVSADESGSSSATLSASDSGSSSDTDSGRVTASNSNSNSLTDTESVTDTESATNTESVTDTESATNTDSVTDTDSAGGCDDGVQNGDETDIDCGGSCAADCDDGQGCLDGDDCVSMACDPDAMICVDPTCTNGMQDGDETDLDCGGSCGSTCDGGEDCLVDLDCVSHDCGDDLTCQPAPLWCIDVDGDGFGDAGNCVMVPVDEDPPDGSVDNDDDCDDASADTFPGAAPNDDALACMKDEDGDDWGDDTPPNGVDPGSDCDEDGAPSCVLIVTQDGTNDNTYDQGLSTVLGDLGFVITYIADTDAVLTDADGFTLVVVSETAQSGDIAGTYQDVRVPTICFEGLVWDDMGMAPEGNVSVADSVDIIAPADPLAGALVGTVDVIMGGGSGTFFTAPPIGAVEIASIPDAPADVVEFAFDQDDAMLGGFVAPRRRVGLGYDADQGNGAVTILDDGLVLFEAAVLWAIG
jgi:hypothetical protein